jgi:hypothetical protein
MRWRQSPQTSPRVSLEVPQPKAAEMHYSSCDLIDQRNRCRQDDLHLERKCVITIWSMRLNVTLIGITVVDSIFLGLGARGAIAGFQSDFCEELPTELVFIHYDKCWFASPGECWERLAFDPNIEG